MVTVAVGVTADAIVVVVAGSVRDDSWFVETSSIFDMASSRTDLVTMTVEVNSGIDVEASFDGRGVTDKSSGLRSS